MILPLAVAEFSSSSRLIVKRKIIFSTTCDFLSLLLEFEWTKEAIFWIIGVAAFLVNFSGFLVMGGGVGWEPSHMFSWVN